MGWWNSKEDPEIATGDAVLDLARHFLHDFSKEFQEDLSRKPNIRELEYALNLAFRVNVDDEVLDDFDELEVKQVVIKTAKIPKKQKVAPGDIFACKLDDGRFVFGRIVIDVSVGSIAEIFDYFSDQPVFDHSRQKKWLIPPLPIDIYSLLETRKRGDWRIIEHHPDYRPDPDFKNLLYVYGSSPNCLTATDIYGNKRAITVEEARGLPKYSPCTDFNFKKLVQEHRKSQ
jgi:hypothetical protein